MIYKTSCSSVIPIGVANRHIHLSEKDFRYLFETYTGESVPKLRHVTKLDVAGQYASDLNVYGTFVKDYEDYRLEECAFMRLRVLVPFRPYSQVELLPSDFKKHHQTPIFGIATQASSPRNFIIINGNNRILVSAFCSLPHLHMDSDILDRLRISDESKFYLQVHHGRLQSIPKIVIRPSPAGSLDATFHVDKDYAASHKIDQDSRLVIR